MDELTHVQEAFLAAQAAHNLGRLAEAHRMYQSVVARCPQHADALHLWGVLAAQVGQNDVAVRLIQQAIGVQPFFPKAYYHLGVALQAAGNCGAAIEAWRQAIAQQPNLAMVHFHLGSALKDEGLLDEAIEHWRQAIAHHPGYAEAHNNLGIAMMEKGYAYDAIDRFHKAIEIKPGFADAYYNLGIALQETDRHEQAVQAYAKALDLRPDYADAQNNLGNTLKDLMRLDDAIAAHRKALVLNPDHPEAHCNLAASLMLTGQLDEGFREYQWRWQCRDFPVDTTNLHQPLWDGSDLTGKTILLHAEQGFGDTLQFIRYVPIVAARGGRIILEVQQELSVLLQGLPGIERMIFSSDPRPDFDVHCPLMSLPMVCRTTLGIIPPPPPLRVDPQRICNWRERLKPASTGLKVALAWAGTTTFKHDRLRSLSLDRLARLLDVPGITFYCVQKGPPASQAELPQFRSRLVYCSPDIQDFSDTAAIMSIADLILTTDTSVAHLAGTMGRPVWIMLQYVPDWRWMLGRSDSPWYPSARLFRQPELGKWDAVIATVAEALAQLQSDHFG